MPRSRPSQPPPPKRRRRAVIATVLTAALVIAGYVTVRRLAPVIAPVLRGSGCQARATHQTVLLDTQQASIAATIAGVAHRQSMPRAAVTVAYATAMQESKLHNLNYGDMDSVGVFQQRPSQGWGPRRKLEDPVYASIKFFRALKAVPGYQAMPVYQAAQEVQRSADGSAYIQYEKMATDMAIAFTGQREHAVYCWWASPVPRRADRSGLIRALAATFGPGRLASPGSQPRHPMLLAVGRTMLGWELSAWLVTHASTYGIHEVRFGGFTWRAAAGSKGWVRDAGAPAAGRLEVS